MSKSLAFFKALWSEVETVVELFVYLGIAYGMHLLFGITYVQAISIVFVYFTLMLARIIVVVIRDRFKQ